MFVVLIIVKKLLIRFIKFQIYVLLLLKITCKTRFPILSAPLSNIYLMQSNNICFFDSFRTGFVEKVLRLGSYVPLCFCKFLLKTHLSVHFLSISAFSFPSFRGANLIRAQWVRSTDAKDDVCQGHHCLSYLWSLWHFYGWWKDCDETSSSLVEGRLPSETAVPVVILGTAS